MSEFEEGVLCFDLRAVCWAVPSASFASPLLLGIFVDGAKVITVPIALLCLNARAACCQPALICAQCQRPLYLALLTRLRSRSNRRGVVGPLFRLRQSAARVGDTSSRCRHRWSKERRSDVQRVRNKSGENDDEEEELPLVRHGAKNDEVSCSHSNFRKYARQR
jgi:hypothetical protein